MRYNLSVDVQVAGLKSSLTARARPRVTCCNSSELTAAGQLVVRASPEYGGRDALGLFTQVFIPERKYVIAYGGVWRTWQQGLDKEERLIKQKSTTLPRIFFVDSAPLKIWYRHTGRKSTRLNSSHL